MTDTVEFLFNKSLYDKNALIKSAYSFTDKAYIHLDSNEKYYIVTLSMKDGQSINYRDFENEMIAQTLRIEIYERTKEIRKLTVARALASTIVGDSVEEKPVGDENINIDNVLKNWFDENE